MSQWESIEDFCGASSDELLMWSMGIVDSKNDIGVGDRVRHVEDGLIGEVIEIGPMGSLVVDWDSSGLLDRCVRSELDLVNDGEVLG